jgi:hypothetical protein
LPIGLNGIVLLLKEESHAVQPGRSLFVQPLAATKRFGLKRLWEVIPQANRQQTLETLSQLIAQQLQAPLNTKEVRYEDR